MHVISKLLLCSKLHTFFVVFENLSFGFIGRRHGSLDKLRHKINGHRKNNCAVLLCSNGAQSLNHKIASEINFRRTSA